MEKLKTSSLKLGIIAGGQLAKMLIQEASSWDIETFILDDDPTCPARGVANHYAKGSRFDFDAVYNFGKMVDILTFEIESINIEALKALKNSGVKILPDPLVLELIQDKGRQKEFYKNNSIPTSDFSIYNSKEDIKKGIEQGEINFPFVQKLRTGGYDGRGVAVIENANCVHKLLDGESVVEDMVDIEKEISVIVARNENGDTSSFPTVEMDFNKKANLVERLISPSRVSCECEKKARAIASDIIKKLNMRGILAVEFFVTKNGEILVNEVAPRPHNSGHHTIESVVTSQYEQHLRAILNLPLGSTEMKSAAVMINLLGEDGYEGAVFYEGLTEAMAVEGAHIHLYGKKITRAYRKMGHITIVASSIDNAVSKSETVKRVLKVKSC